MHTRKEERHACKNAPLKARPRRSRAQGPAAFTFAASLSFGAFSPALAGPTGGVVVEGQGTISTPAAGQTVIDQASHQLHLNWSTFDVGAHESVQFNQPSSSAIAFNRILDQNPSQIFGTIQANGQVVLVNPNGLLIGRTAQLNVGSLVASSLDAIDFDATSGRYRFSTSRDTVGAVINEGSITAGPGGSVTLLGGRVSNTGAIVADLGTVNLAAGRAATIDLAGDGLLRLEVGADLLGNADGSADAVHNASTVQATGGRVLLTAAAVQDVFTNLVNNTGVVRANRIDNSGGTIRLVGPGGTVRSSGTLDASAGDAVSTGGSVEMLGDRVGLFDEARVDVSGATGGGVALIGGDYQGANPDVPNASRTYVSAGTTIDADAGSTGDGGRVIVWADEVTRYGGSITARGGETSGDGGFAEVSGRKTLVFAGQADLSAAAGRRGTLLLDPENITINDSDDAPADALDNTYAFDDDDGLSTTIGNATIETLLETSHVVLQATNDITQEADAHIDVSGVEDAAGHGLTLEAGGAIALNGNITLNNGDVTLDAGNDITIGGVIDTTGGAFSATSADGSVILAAGSDIQADASASLTADDGAIDMQVGALGITSGGNVTLSAGTGGISVTNIAGDEVSLSTSGAITENGASLIAANNLSLSGASVGAAGNAIGTNANGLIASASNGGIYIDEADGLILGHVSASGTGNDVTITAGGILIVDTVTATGGTVSLTSTGGAIFDDADNGTRVTAGTLNLSATLGIGGSAANAEIDTQVGTLSATTTTGSIHLREVDDVNVTTLQANGAGANVVLNAGGTITVGTVSAGQSVTLASTTGSIADDGNNATRIVGPSVSLSAANGIGTGPGGAIDTNATTLSASTTSGSIAISEQDSVMASVLNANGAAGSVTLTAGGDLTVGSITVAQSVTLTSTGGAILDDDSNLTGIAASAGTVTLTANGNIGGPGTNAEIDMDAAVLNATSTTGSIYLREANVVDVNNVVADAPTGTVVLDTGDTMLVREVRAGASVTLAAASGLIQDDSDSSTRIRSNHVSLFAADGIGVGGGASADTDTSANTLDASTTNGNIYITEWDAVILNDVRAQGTGSNVRIVASGDITVGSVSAEGTVDLTTGGSFLDDNDNSTRITGDLAWLTANSGAIGSASATGQIDTAVSQIRATAGNGSVYIGEQDGVSLVDVRAVGAGNDVEITAGGPIAVSTVSATDAVTLRATGAITDLGDTSTRITANSLTLEATGSIGGPGTAAIDTTVNSITATATGGSVYIDETDDVTLTNVRAQGAGNDVVVRSLGGDITVVDVVAPDAVSLTAAGGILDDNDDSTRIQAGIGGVALTAGDRIGTVTNFAGLAGSSVDVNAPLVTASVADGAGDIHLDVAGAALLTANAISLGDGTGSSGQIVIRASGALNAQSDAILVGPGSTSKVALISGGVLGLPADSVTDGPVDWLFVRGATDIVQTGGGTAGEFTFSGVNRLRFESGGANSDVVLHTSVAELDATVGNNRNLTIHETDGVTLGTLDAGTGNVTLTAGGAVLDDNDDTTRVRGTSVSLTGTALGAAGNALDTDTASLSATATAGGIHIRELDALSLAASATGGAVDVQTVNGALTVTSASGTGVTLAAGGAGSQIVLNGAVDGGTGNVSLTAGSSANRGAIVANAGHHVSGNALTVVGSSIGTGTDHLGTTVASLDATATNGGIFVTETDDLTLTANATGGAVDVSTPNGALNVTGASGTGITLVTGGDGNALTVSGAMNAGAGGVNLATNGAGSDIHLAAGITTTGNVSLVAGPAANRGAIVTSAGNHVTANALTAQASSIGSTGTPLGTTVGTIDATTSSGGIFVRETDGVTLTADAGGALQVETLGGSMQVTSANGEGVTLSAGGAASNLVTNGAIHGGSGAVALTAGNQVTLNHAVTAAGNVSVTSGSTLTFNAPITGADISLTAGPANNRAAIVAGTTGFINGTSLVLRGASVGSSAAHLETDVDSIDAVTSNGGIYITEADALTLNAMTTTGGVIDVQTLNGSLNVGSAVAESVTLVANGAGNGITVSGGTYGGVQGRSGAVTLTTDAGGDLVVNASVSTPDQLTLTTGAGGDIVLNAEAAGLAGATITAGTAADRGSLTAGANGRVAGGSVAIVASTVGSSGARLGTAADSLDVTSTAGGIFVTEADDVSLTANATGGDVDVATTNGSIDVGSVAGHSVSLAAGGNGSGIALNGNIAVPGDVSLTAGSAASRGALTFGPGVHISASTLNVAAASVGSGANRLQTTVDSLNATATQGGIYVTETDALTLNASATGGGLDVQTTNGSLTVADASGTGVTLVAGGAGSDITLNGAVNGGSNAVTLTAGTNGNRGALVANAGSLVTGSALTVTASQVGSSTNRLRTNVDALTASASTGSVYVSEQNGITLTDVSATSAGGVVDVSALAGDITVSSVAAASDVTLTANAGAIRDDGDDATRITGTKLTLRAQSIGAPSTISGATLDASMRLDTAVASIDAATTGGGIFIDELDGLSSVRAVADAGAAGDIELLTATGDLNLAEVSASDTLLLAAGHNIHALEGSPPIRARVAELRAGGADPGTGRIGTLDDPLRLELAAGNSLRLFVPQGIDPNDVNRAPSTLPSTGVVTTLSLFGAPDTRATSAGFGQFVSLSDSEFTSAAESLSRTVQTQPNTVQSVLGLDWASFDTNVSLFGTLDPAVCLPADQRDEEGGGEGC